MPVAFGLHSFGDLSGRDVSATRVLRDVASEVALPDEVGVELLK